MNVAFINPFLTATQHVFETMVHVPIRLGRPWLRKPNDSINRLYRVSATIGLNGAVHGLVVLTLTEPVAMALAEGLAGTRPEALNEDCFDALAEIVNMIAGGAKKELPGGQVTLTIPTLLFTEDVVYPRQRPVVVIPFETSVGRFLIEVAITSNASTTQAAPQAGTQAA